MILNEDFFNDIEIKDEDITVEEPVEEPAKKYNEKTSRELIEHKISESEMVFMIRIDTAKYRFYGQYNIWHRIERVMKRLKYMLNIYNISISDPFIMNSCFSFKILEDKEFPDGHTIIQHKGCNLYFHENEFRKYGPDGTIKNRELELFAFLDKKLPVFKTARSAYNFLIRLDKCIWKDVTNFGNNDCFNWCDFYDIDNVLHNDNGIITTYSSDNSYVSDDGNDIYNNILNIVPKKLTKLLENIKLSKFKDKDIKKMDLETIIKMMNQ